VTQRTGVLTAGREASMEKIHRAGARRR